MNLPQWDKDIIYSRGAEKIDRNTKNKLVPWGEVNDNVLQTNIFFIEKQYYFINTLNLFIKCLNTLL